MDRRQHIHRARTVPADRLAAWSRSRTAGRDDWSCSIPADELAFARSVVRRRADHRGARSAGSRTRTVSSAGMHAAGCSWNRGGTLERRWHGEVRRLGSSGRFVAVTDVRACFASIAPTVIDRQLRMLGAPPASGRRDRVVAAHVPGRRRRRAPGRAGRVRPAGRRRADGSATTPSGPRVRASSAGWTTSRSSPPIGGRGRRRSTPSERRGHRSAWRCTSRRPSSWTIHVT